MFGGGGERRGRDLRRGVTKREGGATGQRPDLRGTECQHLREARRKSNLASPHLIRRDVAFKRKKTELKAQYSAKFTFTNVFQQRLFPVSEHPRNEKSPPENVRHIAKPCKSALYEAIN